ncbi:ABC transporter ATP-binding protein [Marinifilum breve]|uniref:ABC transporter ATP-binding protein n=1 Tax=Marinifilum breve TaxID=2184082 RepID=A0A2V4A2I8_9BACT|nr:ABC transporter ATP-binding protein [Marinifilum breve]PXY02087.1 ABC transporter ATP-binding protein [Marinifilum breve]
MKKNNKQTQGLLRLIEIAGTKKWLLIVSMILAIACSVAQFTPFVSVYKILTELAAHATDPALLDKAYIWKWAYITLWSFVAYGALLFSSLMFSHIAAFNILYELRMKLAQKLVRLPMGFFTKRASGDIKKVMSEDVERIELFVAHHIPDIVSAFVFPLLLLTYMYVVDWRLALVVTCVFVMAMGFISSMSFNPKMKLVVEKYLNTMGQMNNSIIEYVRGIQIVKIFNRSTKAFERLNRDIDDFRDFSNDITKKYAPTYLGFYILLSSVLLFVIPVAVLLLLNSESYSAYIPTVLLFLILSGGIFFPMLKLMWIGGMMSQNNVGISMIDEILNKEEITDPESEENPKDASIVFDNVSFAYDTTQILNQVSFTAKPNTVTALVGPSGAGKTTIAMLAARFWDVNSGEIRIGNVPIHKIKVSNLMENIAFVFQDNMLFFDTVEENIRMGNKAASIEQVQQAAQAAQCHEFITKLDQAYNTLVGEGGTYLSGGEQQRIALARAILKDASIILLDEATAYADPENEGKILDSFSHLVKGKTVMVIAHRLSTITNADQILYIDKGKVQEQGTHEELLMMNKEYAHMWQTYSQSREWVIKTEKEVLI